MKYRCSMCKNVYEKGWTEEEATEELKENFPGFNKEVCDIVCDDCYKEMFK